MYLHKCAQVKWKFLNFTKHSIQSGNYFTPRKMVSSKRINIKTPRHQTVRSRKKGEKRGKRENYGN